MAAKSASASSSFRSRGSNPSGPMQLISSMTPRQVSRNLTGTATIDCVSVLVFSSTFEKNRDSLPHLDAHVLQRLRCFSHGQFKIQFLFSFIQQQQRPIVRAQKLIDLLHNRAENLIELQGGRQCLPQLLEDGDLPLFPLPGGHREIAAALHGRKLLYFFHVWLNPVLYILTALPSSPSGGACPACSRPVGSQNTPIRPILADNSDSPP